MFNVLEDLECSWLEKKLKSWRRKNRRTKPYVVKEIRNYLSVTFCTQGKGCELNIPLDYRVSWLN